MIREKIGLLQEELERFESLKSRFAKLSDLLIQRIFPLTDEIVLTVGGTIFDRIYRTEKRNQAGRHIRNDQDLRVEKPDCQ